MSYQANFACHHICDHHVGFLFAWHCIGKHNKMLRLVFVYSYLDTKLQLSDKEYQHTHSVTKLNPSIK